MRNYKNIDLIVIIKRYFLHMSIKTDQNIFLTFLWMNIFH